MSKAVPLSTAPSLCSCATWQSTLSSWTQRYAESLGNESLLFTAADHSSGHLLEVWASHRREHLVVCVGPHGGVLRHCVAHQQGKPI